VYAAHFAAGLAIKSRVPKALTWALLIGVFIPDFVWVVLANRGNRAHRSSIIFRRLVALIGNGWSLGESVCADVLVTEATSMLAVWLAVFSHFLLDLPIHPKFRSP
jgi:hypothetical protein